MPLLCETSNDVLQLMVRRLSTGMMPEVHKRLPSEQ